MPKWQCLMQFYAQEIVVLVNMAYIVTYLYSHSVTCGRISFVHPDLTCGSVED